MSPVINQVESRWFIFIILLEILSRSESIPTELQNAMGKATSLDTFMELLNASDAPNHYDDIPRSRKKDDDTPLTIANEFCKPIEVMVQVPQPKKRRALIFPVYVKLFRCRGGCNIEPRLSQCIALKTKSIPVKVGYVAWKRGENTVSGLKKKVSTKYLQNETLCGCGCKKVRMCNSRSHVWNNTTCRCECTGSGKGSCPPHLVWSIHSCQCECPKSYNVCPGSGNVWNQKECKCMCHESMSCGPGLYLNPETCRCTCHRGWCKFIPGDEEPKVFSDDTIELKPIQRE